MQTIFKTETLYARYSAVGLSKSRGGFPESPKELTNLVYPNRGFYGINLAGSSQEDRRDSGVGLQHFRRLPDGSENFLSL